MVEATRIEFKFHFDYDTLSLRKELGMYGGDVGKLMEAVANEELSPTWTVGPRVYKDVIVKRPDIFVWVLCARDLSKLTAELAALRFPRVEIQRLKILSKFNGPGRRRQNGVKTA